MKKKHFPESAEHLRWIDVRDEKNEEVRQCVP